LPITTSESISTGALIISFISLVISLLNYKSSREIEFIKKKTELLSLLCEEEVKLRKAKWYIEEINDMSPECYKKTKKSREKFAKLIDDCMELLQRTYGRINNSKELMNLVKLLELVPEIKKQQLAFSNLHRNVEDLRNYCKKCIEKGEFESINCDDFGKQEKA
jgi:hypothetical protein